MLILAMDTATPQVAVALGDTDLDGVVGVRGEVRLVGDRRHAEQLAPAIEHLCAQTGVRLDQLGAIAVGIGPGLFTGLRVGVTTAKVMAQALGVPVVAMSSLDLIAAPLRHAHGVVVPVIDARRKEVFWARYRVVPGGVQRESDYEVGAVEDLIVELEIRGDDVVIAGDGVTRYRDKFALLERAEWAGPVFDAPSMTALVRLAAARLAHGELPDPDDVTPMYLRESDADLTLADSKLQWPTPR